MLHWPTRHSRSKQPHLRARPLPRPCVLPPDLARLQDWPQPLRLLRHHLLMAPAAATAPLPMVLSNCPPRYHCRRHIPAMPLPAVPFRSCPLVVSISSIVGRGHGVSSSPAGPQHLQVAQVCLHPLSLPPWGMPCRGYFTQSFLSLISNCCRRRRFCCCCCCSCRSCLCSFCLPPPTAAAFAAAAAEVFLTALVRLAVLCCCFCCCFCSLCRCCR